MPSSQALTDCNNTVRVAPMSITFLAESAEDEQNSNRPPQLGVPSNTPPASFEKAVLQDQNLRQHLLLTALRLTGNKREDAEDLLQSAYLRAIASWSTFDGAYPRAWIATIMRNLTIDKGRSRFRDPLSGAQGEESLETVRSPDTRGDGLSPIELKPFLGDELWKSLYGPKSLIKRDYADMYIDVNVFDMRYREAAEKYGIPEGTVMSRLFRVAERLRATPGVLDQAYRMGVLKKSPRVVAGETQGAIGDVLK